MGGACCKKKDAKVQQIDVFSEVDDADLVKNFVDDALVQEDKNKNYVEAHCTKCNRLIHKSNKRPISGYNWRCDGCGDTHSARPGFEFYTCKKCRMDWCHNDFHLVET
jgi:peptide subunit release factor 1 (eRF1)